MAWRIEYRWNGSIPAVPGPRWPNSSSVRAFGVAVNAKNDRFGCRPRAATSAARASSHRVGHLVDQPGLGGLGGLQLGLGGRPAGAEDLLQLLGRLAGLGGVGLVDDHRVAALLELARRGASRTGTSATW